MAQKPLQGLSTPKERLLKVPLVEKEEQIVSEPAPWFTKLTLTEPNPSSYMSQGRENPYVLKLQQCKHETAMAEISSSSHIT